MSRRTSSERVRVEVGQVQLLDLIFRSVERLKSKLLTLESLARGVELGRPVRG